MKNLTLIIAAFVCLFVVAVQAQEDATEIEWVDINTALENVGENEKKIVIDFYTDWCGWCKVMDRKTYSDSSIVAYINEHYLAVKFNPEKGDSVVYDGETYSARQFAAAWQVRGYPATGFVSKNAEALVLLPGYQGPDEFLRILQYFGGDHHLTSTFEEYVAGENSTVEE